VTIAAELVETLRRLDFIYLRHLGRRSGREYTTELGFAVDEEGLYLLASEESGRQSDWLRNVLAADRASFFAGTRLIEGRVELLPRSAIPRLREMFRARYGGEIVRRWYESEHVTALRIFDVELA
jgi:deazaflavin-dependent oxidoreductase (nitroreductase family)